MKVVLEFVHKTSPHFGDVQGPYEASPSDFETLEAARKWFKRHRITLGKVTHRKEGKKHLFFPASRMASSPHAIVVRPGTSLRLKGREVAEMARRLKAKGYSMPGSYARRLYREGIGLKGKWVEGSGAEGHRAEGGLSRTGRRYVSGVEERLYGTRGGPGSLEVTHGFRDPASRGTSRSNKSTVTYKVGPTGAVVFHLPKGGFVIYWNGPGSRLQLGKDIATTKGWMTPIDHPSASGHYMTRAEAMAAVKRFLEAK